MTDTTTAPDLAPVVAALEEAVTADAANAAALFRVHAVGGDGPTSIRVNRHSFEQDEPAGFGGADSAPGPVDYALAGLASCQIVVFKYWAAKTGVTLDHIAVDVDGDFDFRTMFGFEGGGRPGLTDVRVAVRVSGPEAPERYEELQRLVDAHCPVLDLVAHATPVSTTLTVAS
ncbi:OsmC family protein [Arthrobacter sp. NEB 688]|uniref:OsmC family protein n=1 Tax=Arthrobacter sp. NEB 688 TaxID=904039 RepID=UPI0015644503|nr:OsmC family protein [Arthrobacter sp. NEB 688]QKE83085.1 OsmC family protein [Arthrobacter sp. NEB 688]